jgi:hypothetical protein
MTTGTDESNDTDLPNATTAKWLTLLGLIPMVGVLLFAVAGLLGIRAFSHNNSLTCGFDNPTIGAGGCSHYSYALPIVVGVVAVLLVIGGGAVANYYAMRNVGLPLLSSLRRRNGAR